MLFSRHKTKMIAPAKALPGREQAAFKPPERHAVLGTPLEPPFPEGLRTAVFGLGCFWGAERKFWQIDGVYATAVGYAGGFTPNPTYGEVCSGRTGHTEAVLVVFDPEKVSYRDLLRVFWEAHDPTQGMRQGNDVGTQYRSAIYFTGEEQRRTAEEIRDTYEDALRHLVWAGPLANFTPGHQDVYVNFRNEDRAPLLFIAGGEDNLMPPAVNESNVKHYRHTKSITDYHEFPGRSHFTVGQDGWEEVADYAPGVGRGERNTPCSLSTRPSTRVATEGGDSYEQRVTPLELFFDLVFVFALTQVTGFLADHLTWVGMLQGAALLTALWSSWVVYSWLTNAVPAEDVIPARIVIFCAMAAMFVASLAVPRAFGHYGVIFGIAYFVVQLLQVLLYALATGRDPEQRQAILRLAPGFVGGPALLIVAGFLDGYAQGALWAVALTVGYSVAFVRGVSGFRIHAGHFAERHGLVVIIALGESIVAAGVGVSGLMLGAGVIAAVVVGIALAAALWWAYFDLVMLTAEHRLSEASGEERARLARDCYSYLHLPMVAGIIFVALSVKQTLSHVGDPLGIVAAVALCGGVALYVLGHNGFRLRSVGSVSVPRLVVTMLCFALIPVAVWVPSLITLGVLALLLCGLAAFETVTSREFRRELRAR